MAAPALSQLCRFIDLLVLTNVLYPIVTIPINGNIVTMTNWMPQLAPNRPRYLAIAEAMRADLLAGALKPGERLPTHRDLAYRLGVTTGTVTRAYSEAEKLGILVGEVGRGSFLKSPGPMPQPFRVEKPGDGQLLDLWQASPPMIHAEQDLD